MPKKTEKKAAETVVKENKPKITVEEMIRLLPNAKINKRKDGWVKFHEAHCYIGDITYGVRFRENSHGAPTGPLTTIENSKQMKEMVKEIKNRIKNYDPNATTSRELTDDSVIQIDVKVKTRNRLRESKNGKESYDQLINRALGSLKGQ